LFVFKPDCVEEKIQDACTVAVQSQHQVHPMMSSSMNLSEKIGTETFQEPMS